MKIEDIKEFEDLFVVVEEPDYSKSIMDEMEKKYNISSLEFYISYKNDTLDYSIFDDKNDIELWAHHIEVFCLTGGNLWEEIEDKEDKSNNSFLITAEEHNSSAIYFLYLLYCQIVVHRTIFGL